GRPLHTLVSELVAAVDPDLLAAAGDKAAETIAEAVRPIAANPALRQQILDVQHSKDQVIDMVSADQVLEAGFSAAAKERAQGLVTSFEAFIKEHKDEITALQVLYSK